MAPISSTWSRLIRFVAVETSLVHIGEPIDATMDVGLARREGKTIQAYEIIGSGSALDLSAQVSKNVLTVRELLMPLSREEIKTVRCLGLNYPVHATEANVAVPKFPNLFYKPVTSLIGPGGLITIPSVVQPPKEHQSDYEAELVIVIGKAAKNVSEDEALDYVLGYTAANDISFRKHQLAVSQWSFSKGFDGTNPLGPCLVSASSIPDPQDIPIQCKLNGGVVQNGNTRDQIFNVKKTISFLSQGTTLEPGSIILTGTPDGVGFVRNPPLYLKDGDEVMTWIGSGIGTLANTVREEQTCFASGGHE
nr:CPH [Cloning vector pnnCPH-C1]QJQ48102.1 CPH [Cloning vector pX037]